MAVGVEEASGGGAAAEPALALGRGRRVVRRGRLEPPPVRTPRTGICRDTQTNTLSGLREQEEQGKQNWTQDAMRRRYRYRCFAVGFKITKSISSDSHDRY